MVDLSRFSPTKNKALNFSADLSRFSPIKTDKQKDEEILKKRQQFTSSPTDQNVANVGNFMDQVITPKVDQLKSNIDFQDNITFEKNKSLGLVDGALFPIYNKKEIVTSVDAD